MAEAVKTRINGRWDLMLPPHRAALPGWDMANGGWEPERLAAMYEAVAALLPNEPGIMLADHPPVVLDIGAEEGDIPALMATWGAKVFMVEPNLNAWVSIRKVWEANGLKPLGCFAGFAGAKSQVFEEYSAKTTNKDGWPLCAYDEFNPTRGFDHLAESAHWMNQRRIDDLGIMPDIITVDVEGSELEVMKGAERVLREGSPTVFISVHPEFMFHNHGYYEAYLHGYMYNLGYTKKWLAYDHEHHWQYNKEKKS